MRRQSGFIEGIALYALIALGLAVAGLSLVSYGLYYKAKAAEERASQLTQALEESEARAEALKIAADLLDQQLAAIRKREDSLNAQKRQIQQQLDAIAKTLSEADQACTARSLPDAFTERLLNESDRDKDGKAKGSPSPASPVSEI